MIRGLMNSIVFAGFTLLLPVFGFMAWGWGSSDEKFLMKAVFCALGPFCMAMWVIILRGKPGFFVPFLVIVMGYVGIFFLLKFRLVTF
ncbi:MAG: hypothetical protein ACLPND_03075 [Candidatus Korobacteraceae bacterium]